MMRCMALLACISGAVILSAFGCQEQPKRMYSKDPAVDRYMERQKRSPLYEQSNAGYTPGSDGEAGIAAD